MITLSLLVLLGAVALIMAVIFSIAVAVRGSAAQGGESVIKTVYVYLVLFATLMMVIGGSVGAFMAAADILAPSPYYQTFEEYRRWGIDVKADGESSGQEQLSEAELRERYEAMVQAEKERQVSRAKNSLIKSLGWIVIPLPIFVYFQRLRKEAD